MFCHTASKRGEKGNINTAARGGGERRGGGRREILRIYYAWADEHTYRKNTYGRQQSRAEQNRTEECVCFMLTGVS